MVSLNYAPQTVTAAEYDGIFQRERELVYPAIDALEHRLGIAIDRERLEAAARVLCCPMKAAPPNWQHGRVLFALTREYTQQHDGPFRLLDIGTAKGFSALCLLWGVAEGKQAEVFSVDVMPPDARVRRNTVAEVEALLTLREILEPWPEAHRIRFQVSTGVDWLRRNRERVHLAFVDGKHTGEVVAAETALLAMHQVSGDVVVFDDVQIPGVAKAVNNARDLYDLEPLKAKPGRTYVIARRR